MCGIFGYVGLQPPDLDDLVAASSRLLGHRGPDDQGFKAGNGWGLGFRRLSILDLSELGHQPMHTPDERFWIVFNGEIYNYLELRHQMECHGEQFRGASDTEVLLRLLAREGPRGLEKLNGMFSLVLVDTQERTFLMARDRMGQKPLYYSFGAHQLRFASELKALLGWPDAHRDLDPMAVAQYLAFDYIPIGRSIFTNYSRLPQGCYLTGSLEAPHSHRLEPYWQLDLNGEDGRPELSNGQLDDLQELLADATRIRLRSDVPVGIFLSGGIDSGLIAAFAAESGVGEKLRALTVGFDEEEYDETVLARSTAEHVGLEQCLVKQEPGGLAEVDRLSWFFDEPFGDPSAIPTFNLCQAAAEYATVFLAGDGGDEAFGGYRKYIRTLGYRASHAWPAPIGAAVEAASKVLPELSSLRYRVARKSLPDGGFSAAIGRPPIDPVFHLIASSDLLRNAADIGRPWWDSWRSHPGPSVTARWQATDYALYLPDDILVKVDRASMAHSIELRSPYLDYRVVEWAARLPRAALLNTKEGKLPLRALADRLLPAGVRSGGKRGFGAPLGEWFRRPEGQRLARERLLGARARERGLWNHEGVERLITTQQSSNGRDLGDWLWRLLVLDAWARQYLDSRDFLQGPPSLP